MSDDPLQAFLISLKLLAETMADLPSGHPGCLIASICYQERLFDREVRELTAQSVRDWNARFRGILDGIAAVYPPREPVDLDDVADKDHVVTRVHPLAAASSPAGSRSAARRPGTSLYLSLALTVPVGARSPSGTITVRRPSAGTSRSESGGAPPKKIASRRLTRRRATE